MLYKFVLVTVIVLFAVIDAAPLTVDYSTATTNPFKSKQKIFYSIINNPDGLLKHDVQRVMRKAFTTWSNYISLTFTEVHPKNIPADIQIIFGPDNHGPDTPFNGVYAHAIVFKEIHFNSDFKWKVYFRSDKFDEQMPDLYYHALFVVGQVIGLKNTNDPQSIMYNRYIQPVDPNGDYVEPTLSQEDIKSAQKIYGLKTL